MSRGLTLIGVDFTSAPRPRKPITLAVGRLAGGASRPVYRLEGVRELGTLEAFEGFLREPAAWLGGFDLPFGQPRSLIEHEGWPTTWQAFVAFYCRQPKPLLRERFRAWCAARAPGDKFAWRKADKPAGSSPAMRWANPPVAWMMHAGIGRMLAAGLDFPAHRVRGPRSAFGRRVALEAYPGFTARKVVRTSYKSDVPASQTVERQANRRRIVTALLEGAAGLTPKLDASPAMRRSLVADAAGDRLDAVICGLQAGHASLLADHGLPRDLDPLEGWIASVPRPPEFGAHSAHAPDSRRLRSGL